MVQQSGESSEVEVKEAQMFLTQFSWLAFQQTMATLSVHAVKGINHASLQLELRVYLFI